MIRPSTALMIGTIPLSAATIASVMPQLSLIVSCLALRSAPECSLP